MRLICVAALIVVTACGPFAETPAQPSPGRGSSTFRSQGPPAPGPAALVVQLAPPSTYTLGLVFGDGHVVGPVSARLRTAQPLVRAAPAAIPVFSASDSRAYYLDGDSEVRFLGLDGSRGIATHLAGGTRALSGFAVSPDDRRLAVAEFDYSVDPAALRLYVEDLAEGRSPVELGSSTGSYAWPVGWHGGAVVMALGSPATQNVPNNPYGTFSGYQMMDATTGNRLASIQCSPTGALTPAGTACLERGAPLAVQDFAGHSRSVGGIADQVTSAALAPDGARLAFCCLGGELQLWDAASGSVRPLGASSDRGYGWIDPTHLVAESTPPGHLRVVEVTTGTSTPVTIQGQLVGRIPGGL